MGTLSAYPLSREHVYQTPLLANFGGLSSTHRLFVDSPNNGIVMWSLMFPLFIDNLKELLNKLSSYW